MVNMKFVCRCVVLGEALAIGNKKNKFYCNDSAQ